MHAPVNPALGYCGSRGAAGPGRTPAGTGSGCRPAGWSGDWRQAAAGSKGGGREPFPQGGCAARLLRPCLVPLRTPTSLQELAARISHQNPVTSWQAKSRRLAKGAVRASHPPLLNSATTCIITLVGGARSPPASAKPACRPQAPPTACAVRPGPHFVLLRGRRLVGVALAEPATAAGRHAASPRLGAPAHGLTLRLGTSPWR